MKKLTTSPGLKNVRIEIRLNSDQLDSLDRVLHKINAGVMYGRHATRSDYIRTLIGLDLIKSDNRKSQKKPAES